MDYLVGRTRLDVLEVVCRSEKPSTFMAMGASRVLGLHNNPCLIPALPICENVRNP